MPRTILTMLALLPLMAGLARAQPQAAKSRSPMGVRKLAPAGPWEIVEGDRPVLRYNYQSVSMPDTVKPRIALAIRNTQCRGPITSTRSTDCTARS